ncbi:phosphate ABC transporter permease PstA [Pelagibacterium xiamenense]|uniref:phosphate ABC transporter permease PstA n=1 Tax=Pelagibacterium xiamenense TaxID=2901140 RepID=UPI001E36825A|nr:phosphate ABC transporter permease PstA [Pelagibacterium xiamenense]MCD7058986.1 phosphate ABC transporter permease PstA [Pelagibacterium xiamenense]
MTDATQTLTGDAATQARISAIRSGLARRHRSEAIFRGLGIGAILLALALVGTLFYQVFSKGTPAFFQATLHLDVTFSEDVVTVGPAPQREQGMSNAEFQAAMLDWRRGLALVNWNGLIEGAVREKAPGFEIDAGDIRQLVDNNAGLTLRSMFENDPSLLGQTVPVSLLASANTDNWLKGTIDRSLPDDRQQLSAPTRELADRFRANGVIGMDFAWHIFTNTDSRTAPAAAGLAGAFVGSLYMMVVVILLAVPIGVASAVYLEEFAPQNRATDLIEVNINNLAAVPSIVFGLLGAAVFINYFRLPISAPIVGGLVLTLMTLPTIIIATRSALRQVSPSLRQAALGLGASRTQMVFHHVLPLTFPGILTATIIGVAQALGETAPLLLIGMNAFVASIPATPFDQSTALPVQIYLWQGNENRNFFEARTSAAIMVLLGLMILLNAIAIFLRTRLERQK